MQKTDPVGAGDSTSAGMVIALAAGSSPLEAAAFGNLIASITVAQIGIVLRPDADGGTYADVTYAHTSLGTEEGNAAVAAF
ncbi:MAG: PfkB family carbohydrate kinase, partial [Anaerolineales bacterium]|nr:PfkB family carbohydrate kinase [Anaerolineales bacterium]